MEHLSRLSLRYYTTGPHLLFSAWLYSLAFGTRLGFFKLRRLWTILSCSVSYIAVICLLMLLVSVWIYGNDLICFSTVWPDTHPCGSLHGPWEHCPCSDAPWSITQHDQRSEWKCSNALLDVRSTCFFFLFSNPTSVHVKKLLGTTVSLCLPARWDSSPYGSQGRPGRRSPIPAQERSQSGDQVQG